MSLHVGLGASEADLEVQGEIDFDFFEEDDATTASWKASSGSQICDELSGSQLCKSDSEKKTENYLPNASESSAESDLNVPRLLTNVLESDSSGNLKNPIITISCDNGTVQKTTIEAVIPTPFNYKDNKCGTVSPSIGRKDRRIHSPRMRSKIFNDENDFSDDSSLSSMSPSESDLSSVSDESCDQGEGNDSMTDVSPIFSPFQCNSPIPTSQNGAASVDSDQNDKMPKKDGVKFIDDVENKCCANCETVDLHELLKAVKRLEIQQNLNTMCKEKPNSAPVMTHNAKCKKNLSFSNDEVRRIDNENQRLLRKIITQQKRSKPRPSSAPLNPPSSAINRHRQQRQIELENMALLRRLESAKPSRDLSRFHLLRDYERRSSASSSRASSRSSQPYCSSSQTSSCRTSAQSSGRSSTISLKSVNTMSSGSHLLASCMNKPKRAHMITTAKN